MIRSYPGYFITLEGPEGCGKTYQLPFIVEDLRSQSLTVYPTREPGGNKISEQIREVIHANENSDMHFRAETLLYQAARAQTVERVFIPALKRGEILISDRYYDSTVAYQGFGHKQDLNEIKRLISYATGGLTPDLTILFDLDPAIGRQRKIDNGSEMNRMDLLPPEFYERVRAGYLQMANEEPNRFRVVDGNQTRGEVFADLKREIENSLYANGFLERGKISPER